MFGKSAKTGGSSNSSSSNGVQGDQKIRRAQVDTLIGRGTTIDGDLRFNSNITDIQSVTTFRATKLKFREVNKK